MKNLSLPFPKLLANQNFEQFASFLSEFDQETARIALKRVLLRSVYSVEVKIVLRDWLLERGIFTLYCCACSFTAQSSSYQN